MRAVRVAITSKVCYRPAVAIAANLAWQSTHFCEADARQLLNFCAAWTQFSASSAGTRADSPKLFVTSTRPSLRACAAMCMSFTPIRWPSFSKAARMVP